MYDEKKIIEIGEENADPDAGPGADAPTETLEVETDG